MKKIAALAPIAILLGLPASSIAMEVELYGLIDTGFKYQNTDDFQTGKNASSFAMVSGERNARGGDFEAMKHSTMRLRSASNSSLVMTPTLVR